MGVLYAHTGMLNSNQKAIVAAVLLGLALGISTWWNLRTSPDSPEVSVSDWKTAAYENGIALQYPKRLPTSYVDALDWPPQAQVTEGPLMCTNAGEETARAGKTERRTIEGHNYCVTEIVEGAAGSIYTQYAYATERGNKVIILTFSTRAVQCGNLDERAKAACEAERASFDLDSLIDRIFSTI